MSMTNRKLLCLCVIMLFRGKYKRNMRNPITWFLSFWSYFHIPPAGAHSRSVSEGREQVRVNSVRVCLSGLRRRRRRSPQPPLRAVRVWVGEQLGIAKVHGRVQVDVRPGGNLVVGQYLRNGIIRSSNEIGSISKDEPRMTIFKNRKLCFNIKLIGLALRI